MSFAQCRCHAKDYYNPSDFKFEKKFKFRKIVNDLQHMARFL